MNRGARAERTENILGATQSSPTVVHSPKYRSKITYRMKSCLYVFSDTLHQQKQDAMNLRILHKS